MNSPKVLNNLREHEEGTAGSITRALVCTHKHNNTMILPNGDVLSVCLVCGLQHRTMGRKLVGEIPKSELDASQAEAMAQSNNQAAYEEKFGSSSSFKELAGLAGSGGFAGTNSAQGGLSNPSSGLKNYSPVPVGKITLPEGPKEVEDFSSAVPVMDEQKFVQRIGMQSNCNVSIQSKTLGGILMFNVKPKHAYRLICDRCKEVQTISDAIIIDKHMYDHPLVAGFCKNHRHLVEAPVSRTGEGRKFRYEEEDV